MNTIAMKFQTGTAALAIAAAATLIPVSAQAAPDISVPTAPVSQVLDRLSEGPAALADVNWWFFLPGFGTASPNSNSSLIPQGLTLLHIDIPILTPLLIKPLLGALGLLNKQIICLGGLAGVHTNAYGAINITLFGC
jgi:hypothetical protein